MRGPKAYRSIEEFEREEIRAHQRYGFSLDDLYNEANFQPSEDNSFEQRKELDFDP